MSEKLQYNDHKTIVDGFAMKSTILQVGRSLIDFLGVALLLAMLALGLKWAPSPHGSELSLMEAARFIAGGKQGVVYAGYNPAAFSLSPLLALIAMGLVKFAQASILIPRFLILMTALAVLMSLRLLGGVLFNAGVGLILAGLFLGSWGFFVNSHTVNAAIPYLLVVTLFFFLFYQWFDSAFRSRTVARSLYTHFMMMGILLGLAFFLHGLAGVLFPLLVAGTTIALGSRPEILFDMQFKWIFLCFGVVTIAACALGTFMLGAGTFWGWIFAIHPGIRHFFEPLGYLMPLFPLFIPAFISKDAWSRATLSHYKALYLLGAWWLWGCVFLIFYANLHETFSLLIMFPILVWTSFYLSEVFKKPELPKSINIIVDGMAIMGLVTSVFVSQMAFHLRPSPMQVAMQMSPQPLYTHFILLALVIFVLSAFLVVIRSVVISRILPFYLIPASIALFLMIQTTVTPVVDFRATDYLITHIPQKLLAGEPYRIVCWQSNEERDGLYSRMLMTDASVIQSVYSMTALDRLLARRHPLLFMVIPESQYFAIPDEIRSQGGSIMATSWRWKVSLSLPLMVAAFSNETLDFHTLTEPVILVRIPPRR